MRGYSTYALATEIILHPWYFCTIFDNIFRESTNYASIIKIHPYICQNHYSRIIKLRNLVHCSRHWKKEVLFYSIHAYVQRFYYILSLLTILLSITIDELHIHILEEIHPYVCCTVSNHCSKDDREVIRVT